jgi:hypothetical protein
VPARARHQSRGPREVDPLFCGEEETVSAALIFNSPEFEGIKIRVVDPLPDASTAPTLMEEYRKSLPLKKDEAFHPDVEGLKWGCDQLIA